MSETKARLIGAITVMDEAGAQRLWDIVERLYSENIWDNIEEEEPDKFDLQMMREADENPDCHTYISSEELRKMLQ